MREEKGIGGGKGGKRERVRKGKWSGDLLSRSGWQEGRVHSPAHPESCQ